MRRLVPLLSLAAFLVLTTGLAQVVHLHQAETNHHADDCGLCVMLVGGKVAVTHTPDLCVCGRTEGVIHVPAPTDDPVVVFSNPCISLRGPPLV